MANNDPRDSVTADDRGVAIGGGGFVEFWKPLVWTAIVGGAVAALGVQLIFTLLGVGVGAALMDPIADPGESRDIGMGPILWLVISGIISFGIGGWVAGYTSGVLRTGSGAMHGVASWAFAAVFGATVTALAGAPVLGGAFSGIGASDRNNVVRTEPREGAAPGSDRDTRYFIAGREVTEAEARQAADDAREELAKASLATGLAFLLSLVASGVGGTLGRRSPSQVLKEQTEPRGRVRHA